MPYGPTLRHASRQLPLRLPFEKFPPGPLAGFGEETKRERVRKMRGNGKACIWHTGKKERGRWVGENKKWNYEKERDLSTASSSYWSSLWPWWGATLPPFLPHHFPQMHPPISPGRCMHSLCNPTHVIKQNRRLVEPYESIILTNRMIKDWQPCLHGRVVRHPTHTYRHVRTVSWKKLIPLARLYR